MKAKDFKKGKSKQPGFKTGYLFLYKAKPTDTYIEFARLHQIKVVTTISIYSNDPERYQIDNVLKNRKEWLYDNELKYLDYEFVKVEPINKELTKIRKTCYWQIELKQGSHLYYHCYTTLNQLKYLVDKHRIQAWIFTGIISNKTFVLKHASDYLSLIKKGNVLVFNPFLANECLKLRALWGHTINFIYDKKLIPNFVTFTKKKRKLTNTKLIKDERVLIQPKLLFEHDPQKQKLVCITDGITVHRIKQYKADKLIKEFPQMKFCTKDIWQKYFNGLKSGESSKLFIQGSKTNLKDTRPRKERRSIRQKRKLYSRHYKSQFVVGKWVLNETGDFENFVETHNKKTILHYRKPQKDTIKAYNPNKRKKPSVFEKIETDKKGIKINKFPYHQPITVIYTKTDEKGVKHTSKVQNVKMIGKKIVIEDSKTKEMIVVCPVKDIIKWVYQKNYSETEDEKTNWIPFATITSYKETKYKRIPFHLPKKKKKTKWYWRHPIKGKRIGDKNQLPF